MFEKFDDESVLTCPKGSFDKEAFLARLLAKKRHRLLYKNSYLNKKEDKLKLLARFDETADEYIAKLWEKTVGDDQIIPMDYWHPVEFFDAGGVSARLSPHFMTALYTALERGDSGNKTLVLVSCKEVKPYNIDQSVRALMNIAPEAGFDVAVLSASVCPAYPYDATTQYPFNIYNWPDNRHGQYDELVCQQTTMQLGYMIAKKGYTKVILISGTNPHYSNQFDEMKRSLGHICEFHQIGRRDGLAFRVVADKFGNGLASLRYTMTIAGRIFLMCLVGANPDVILAKSLNYEAVRDEFLERVSKYVGEEVTLDNLAYWLIKYEFSIPEGVNNESND